MKKYFYRTKRDKSGEPEKVFFFQKELQIRTNWDIEEVWKIE